MAKDDYDVLVYKILVYLYACMRRKALFTKEGFAHAIQKDKIDEDYLTDVLRMMQGEGLIEGLTFVRAWGQVYILASGMDDISITSSGIRYLKENAASKQVKQALLDAIDPIASLIIALAL